MPAPTMPNFGNAAQRIKPVPGRITRNGTKMTVICLLAALSSRADFLNSINPVGLAVVSASLGRGQEFYFIFLSVAAGMLSASTGTALKKYALAMLFYAGLNQLLTARHVPEFKKSLLGAAAAAAAGVIYAWRAGGLGYLYFLALLEGALIFCLSYPMGKALEIIKGSLWCKTFSPEETMSLLFVFAAAAAGGNLSLFRVPIWLILTYLFILISSYSGSALTGGAMGIISGLMLMICKISGMELFFVLSLSGLAAGLIRSGSKAKTILAFGITLFLMSFYIRTGVEARANLISFSAAAAVFLMIPRLSALRLSGESETVPEPEHTQKIKLYAAQKLSAAGVGFAGLSGIFSGESPVTESEPDFELLMTRVGVRMCKNCGLAPYCWERDIKRTRASFAAAFSACGSRGFSTAQDLPESFAEACVNTDGLITLINREFDLKKRDMFWERRIEENRRILGEEFYAFSRILENIAKDIVQKFNSRPDLELLALSALGEAGIKVLDISVWDNKEVSIVLENCRGTGDCSQNIAPIVNRVLGTKLRVKNQLCMSGGTGPCRIELMPQTGVKVFAEAATFGKDEPGVSGDCYSIMEVGGKKVLCLSDGMGQGVRARQASKRVVELLELLLESGFDAGLAVKLINSSLAQHNYGEIFSTLDICVIDLSSGAGEFIKAGASWAYVIRGGKIRAIKAGALPVGILAEAETEHTRLDFKTEDIIIMLTDGVWDIMERHGRELWLLERVRELKTKNPSEIAGYILSQARLAAAGEEKDDMTVLTARIWEIP